MTEIPGVTRPKTELERAREELAESRTAVLILCDQLGGAGRYNTQIGRIERALRVACVGLHRSADRVEALESE
jgi:hypothetical protein